MGYARYNLFYCNTQIHINQVQCNTGRSWSCRFKHAVISHPILLSDTIIWSHWLTHSRYGITHGLTVMKGYIYICMYVCDGLMLLGHVNRSWIDPVERVQSVTWTGALDMISRACYNFRIVSFSDRWGKENVKFPSWKAKKKSISPMHNMNNIVILSSVNGCVKPLFTFVSGIHSLSSHKGAKKEKGFCTFSGQPVFGVPKWAENNGIVPDLHQRKSLVNGVIELDFHIPHHKSIFSYLIELHTHCLRESSEQRR